MAWMPLEQKRTAKIQRELEAAKALTFEQAAVGYHTQHSTKWRSPKHAREFISSLEQYAFPVVGALPVGAIDTPLVLRVLERPIEGKSFWAARPETADRVRGRIEAVLDWATVRGLRPGQSGALEGLPRPGAPRPRQGRASRSPALRRRAGLPGALRARDGIDAAALEFLILAAARTGEVLGAKWSEVDLEASVWTIPAGRMKANREHRVPLSTRCIEILRSVPREAGNDFVFPAASPAAAWVRSLLFLAEADAGHRDGPRLQSSFRDWAAERTNFPREVAEQALAHAVGDAVERSYRRTDLFDHRRRLMADWAAYCSAPAAARKVTPIRGRRGVS